jgi:hypothetical protein
MLVYDYGQFFLTDHYHILIDNVPIALTFDAEVRHVVLSDRTLSRYFVTGRIRVAASLVFRKGIIHIRMPSLEYQV